MAEICTRTPHGVLCFFSSYSLMNKLTKRWQGTGLWRSIGAKKKLFVEPRGGKAYHCCQVFCHQNIRVNSWSAWVISKLSSFSLRSGDKDAFDTLLTNFYVVITETNSGPTPSGHDGALLFAVCRGKVSEGMDFTG